MSLGLKDFVTMVIKLKRVVIYRRPTEQRSLIFLNLKEVCSEY